MALLELRSEEKEGPRAQSVNEMVKRLTAIDWFVNSGQQNIEAEQKVDQFMEYLDRSEYEIKWISRNQVTQTIERLSFEGCAFWEALKEVPDQLKKKIVHAGNENLLADMADKVPEAIFHGACTQAFHLFGDEKVVQILVGLAMYVSVLTCAAELAGGQNIFLPMVELLEAGHLPLGPEGNIFYLL